MLGTRTKGLTHAYLDKEIEGFSNIAVGLLIRAIGHNLRIAYIDTQDKATKFNNFLENLSLSYSFTKKFNRLSVDLYTFKQNNKIMKSLIPQVEFYTIDEKIFYQGLTDYDLIIFDNLKENKVDKFKLLNLINNKGPETELVLIFSDEKEFNEIKDNADLITVYEYTKRQLFGSKGIINVTGNGKGKSTYGFGYLIRNFINKRDVKLVYFDKGGDFYGEKHFFESLKKWSKENNLYGKFDYVSTGLTRFTEGKFRFENTDLDVKEAKEGLMLLKTSLKKQTPVIAEELNTTIQTGLLTIEEILPVLQNAANETVITGRYSPKEILDISTLIIEAKEIKHYSKKGEGVRKGIDF